MKGADMSQQPSPNDTQRGAPNNPGTATGTLGNPGIDPVKGEGKGPGAAHVGVKGIVALTAYLVLFAIFLIYSLIVVWPVPTPSGEDNLETANATAAAKETPAPAVSTPPTTTAGATSTTPSPTPTPTPTPVATPP